MASSLTPPDGSARRWPRAALLGDADSPRDRSARLFIRLVVAVHWASGTALAVPRRWPALSISSLAAPASTAEHLLTAAIALGALLGSAAVLVSRRFRLGAGVLAIAIASAGVLHAPAFAHHRLFTALLLAVAALAPRGRLGQDLRWSCALLYGAAAASKGLDADFLTGGRLTHLLSVLREHGPFYSPGIAPPGAEGWVRAHHALVVVLQRYPAFLAWGVLVLESLIATGYAFGRVRRCLLAWPLHLGILVVTGSPWGSFFSIGLLAPVLLRPSRSNELSGPSMSDPGETTRAGSSENRKSTFRSPTMVLLAFIASMALAGPLAHPVVSAALMPLFLFVVVQANRGPN